MKDGSISHFQGEFQRKHLDNHRCYHLIDYVDIKNKKCKGLYTHNKEKKIPVTVSLPRKQINKSASFASPVDFSISSVICASHWSIINRLLSQTICHI